MAKDAELERLKVLQDQAFQRKQEAFQAQQRAWEKRSSARDAMNRAFEARDRAYSAQQSAWQDYQRVKSSNGPRIDSLNSQQESAFQNMKRAYDNASSAYDRHDGASASRLAAEGRGFKEEAQRCVAERRKLVEEIRSARSKLEPYQREFQHAKGEFFRTKSAFETAKSEHERAQAEFKRRKAEFDQAVKAFQDRLTKVKAENKKRSDDKRSIAEKAGVPHQYRDKVWVSKQPDGTTNIYFGGVGKPDGPGHGHYVLDRNGTVTYERDPFDPHGAHNFKSNQADYFDAVRTESISGTDEFGFRCTYKGMPATVETGYDERTGRQKINIYYGAPGGTIGRGHGHAVAYRDAPFTIVSDRSPR